jgi:hypothetical protein
MAEIIETSVSAPEIDPAKAELANAMAFALGTKPVESPVEQVVEPAPVEPTITPFLFDTFKEKFGYQKPEDAFTEIEQLRALKNAPPPPPTYEFENEESRKLFESLTKGDKKAVIDTLIKQDRIEQIMALEVNPNTAAEIVKYGMQLRYKDLSPAEIDYKFKKQFSTPSKPLQTADEEDDSYQARLADWQEKVNDAQMDLMIEAKTAKPEIEAAKLKLVLPEIEQQVDEDYLNYKKDVEERTRMSAETQAAYKAYTPDSIETKLAFADEANGVALEYHFKPDQASFAQALEMVNDIDKFYDLFQKPDGSPDRLKFLKTIHNVISMDKMITEAMVQAKNATLKSMLPDNTQPGGMVRHLTAPAPELTDLDKYMIAAGIKR